MNSKLFEERATLLLDLMALQNQLNLLRLERGEMTHPATLDRIRELRYKMDWLEERNKFLKEKAAESGGA